MNLATVSGADVRGATEIGAFDVTAPRLGRPWLVARRAGVEAVRPEAWDDFAKSCGASFKSSSGHLAGWRLKNISKYNIQQFEMFSIIRGEERKIGQCAIGKAVSGKSFFLDRLQLLPKDAPLWSLAMAAVLQAAGPGEYEYGWELNQHSCP